MDFEDIKAIYGRLGDISVKIEPKTIPNPRYISEKIGQCHICIEEVEKYYIKVSREMSILQRALNNAEADFSMAKDELISSEEIALLPSVQSREARANSILKDKIQEIKNLKNQLSDLEKIFETINVKLKNLTRTNGDIRIQLRLMESQIKLGTGGIGDPIEKNLMDELKNTAIGVDILEGAESKSEEASTVDPTKPIGMDIFGPETQDAFASLESGIKDLFEKNINNDPIPETAPEVIQDTTTDSGIITDINSPLISEEPIINLSDPSFFTEVNNTQISFGVSDSDSVNTQPGQDPKVVDLDRSLIGDSDGIPVPPEEPVIPVSPVDELEQPEDSFNGYVNDYEKDFPEDDILASIEPSEEIEPEAKPTELNLDLILSSVQAPVTTPVQAPVEVVPVIESIPVPMEVPAPVIETPVQVPVTEVPIIGGEKSAEIIPIIESQPKTTLQEASKDPNEIDFSALLSQFN